MSPNDVVAIDLEFPCADGGSLSGSVSVTPFGPNLYRLEETPFASFVEEAGFGDVIEVAANTRGTLVFQRVVQRSNYKSSEWVFSRAVVESERFQHLLEKVEGAGGQWERVFGGIVFIHIPHGSNFDVTGDIQQLDALVV